MKPITPAAATMMILALGATAGSWALCLWGPSLALPLHKYEHMLCFSVWTATVAGTLRVWLGLGRRTTVAYAAMGGMVAGGLGELSQFGMSNHTPEWRGFAWSCAGVAVALAVVIAVFLCRPQSEPRAAT
jgi:hypothetical protein